MDIYKRDVVDDLVATAMHLDNQHCGDNYDVSKAFDY